MKEKKSAPKWYYVAGFILIAILVVIIIVLTFGQFGSAKKTQPDPEELKKKLKLELENLRRDLEQKEKQKAEIEIKIRKAFWWIRFGLAFSYVGLNFCTWWFGWFDCEGLGRLMDLNQFALLGILTMLFIGSRKTYDIVGLVHYIRDVLETYYYRKFAPQLRNEIDDLKTAIVSKETELAKMTGAGQVVESILLLPQIESINYPRTPENIKALLDHHFDRHNISREKGVEILLSQTRLSTGQIEFMLSKLSQAYHPIFLKHLKEPITDSNLIQYGLDAIHDKEINGSQNRVKITMEFREFILK